MQKLFCDSCQEEIKQGYKFEVVETKIGGNNGFQTAERHIYEFENKTFCSVTCLFEAVKFVQTGE